MTGVRWKSRGSYGRMLHKTIKRLQLRFEDEKEHEKITSLAKTIGYLVSVQRELIKDETTGFLEQRLEELERKAGIR